MCQVELSMYRRCGGEEPGLECCLSLRPARDSAAFEMLKGSHSGDADAMTFSSEGGLADSTVDPQKVLEAGHAFLDRGQCEGLLDKKHFA